MKLTCSPVRARRAGPLTIQRRMFSIDMTGALRCFSVAGRREDLCCRAAASTHVDRHPR
jgi:hypothetical protein